MKQKCEVLTFNLAHSIDIEINKLIASAEKLGYKIGHMSTCVFGGTFGEIVVTIIWEKIN